MPACRIHVRTLRCRVFGDAHARIGVYSFVLVDLRASLPDLPASECHGIFIAIRHAFVNLLWPWNPCRADAATDQGTTKSSGKSRRSSPRAGSRSRGTDSNLNHKIKGMSVLLCPHQTRKFQRTSGRQNRLPMQISAGLFRRHEDGYGSAHDFLVCRLELRHFIAGADRDADPIWHDRPDAPDEDFLLGHSVDHLLARAPRVEQEAVRY